MGRGEITGALQRELAGVVLAAGAARRMGSPKLLLPWGQDNVLGCTLANAMAGGVSPLTVICGGDADALERVAKTKGLPCLYNENYAQGQSTSLICGLNAVPQGLGAMFILGDMPSVLPQSYTDLATAYRQSTALIVVPFNSYGCSGNPTIWSPELFREIQQLSGDKGARELLKKYRKQTLFVPLDDPGLYEDIDTIEDYMRQYKKK
ncbi:MAG: nucleotidyltransferase family protein [Clostridiales bacterium]|nr:nucleotidyltransferase family protein [Clostridiales bacterium]